MENVFLVTIDSLRVDSISPDFLSKPATQARRYDSFNQAFATGPGTTPSFPALLTGVTPLSEGSLGPLTDERPRLSGLLREQGLRTGGFQCNPFLSSYFNYDSGFDKFEDYQNPLMGFATKLFPRGIEINTPKLRKVDDLLHLTDAIKKLYQVVKGKPRPYVSAEVITDDTLEWLVATDQPFFCWTHYMDVHHPCFPPREYRERHDVAEVTQGQVSDWYSALVRNPDELTEDSVQSLRRLYEAAIDYTFDQIARIIDHLEETNRYDDTLIILTSDHGELFGEHGEYGKPERMYDELLHVPLIVANGPDYLEDATDDLVSLLDIPPLIHDTLGFDVPEEYEGRIPGKDEPREYVMAEHEVHGDVIVGARSKEFLYEGDEIRGEHRLFDVRDGKFERVAMADHPEAKVLQAAVLDRLASLDIEPSSVEDAVEGDVRDRLEDLGYL